MRKYLLLLLAAAMTIAACQKPQEPDGSIEAKGETSFSSQGGKVTLKIVSNCNWALVAPRGVTVNPASGTAGEFEVEASVAPNQSAEDLEYTLEAKFTNIEGKSISKTISFKLAALVPDPTGNLTIKGDAAIGPEGGDVSLEIVANCAWQINVPEGVTANPTSGEAGTHEIVVTIPANTEPNLVNYTIEAVMTNSEGKTFKRSTTIIVAAFFPEPAGTLSVEGIEEFDFYGGEMKVELTSNCSWRIKAPAGLSVTPQSGDAGTHEIVIVIPANDSKADQGYNFTVVFTNIEGKSIEKTFGASVKKPYVSYAGVDYKIVRLADGNVWMAENLRYVPEGQTVSDLTNLTGIYYPLAVKDGVVNFSTEDEDIAANGLYYSTEVAFGAAITIENANSFEGCRGICPEGWHIPTLTELTGLVGKCSASEHTNTSAPYFDVELNNGSISKLKEDNANIKAYGGVSVASTSATTGTMLKVLNNGDFNTGYFLGSSLYQVTKNADGTMRNSQFFGMMPNMKNGTINVAYVNYRFGSSLRCIRNK